MFGFDASHSRTLAYANTITSANAAHLVPDWTSLPTGGSIFSSPVLFNGIVYAGSFDGHLYAFAADGCGRINCPPLWMSTFLGDRLFSTPAVYNGVVYIGSYDHRLYALSASGCGNFTCSPLWRSVPTGGQIDSSPLWVSPPAHDALFSSPVIAKGAVYIGSLDHSLYAFHLPETNP
ncbi:MAG TPA: PQQ-binding-like beta-propeller repeat protein [Ktedonobacteraceae bacterium]|jgi:outer membrane protein assembly factor BamB|nr:PQQ-binding-like beta-propeller repeat protein [Ktedonobacteraceae bacterium]